MFVTAHEDAAVDAFAVRAVDYLLKPLRQERLAEALFRLAAAPVRATEADTVAVELGGVTRFVAVADVRFVEAQGDYARLHTATGSHLVRIPMAQLEQRWAVFGFVRVHRSFLVAASHITELRVEPGGGHAVRVGTGDGATTIPVSRRHTRELKDRLVRRARDVGRACCERSAAARPGHQPPDVGARAGHPVGRPCVRSTSRTSWASCSSVR